MEESSSVNDFVIRVENERIPCNKDILSKQSDYFQALFCSKMAECQDNTVTLQDVSHETVLMLVNCMNTGNLTLNDETLANVVQAAVRFQIPTAIESCECYMLMNLDNTNCFSCYQMAKSLCLKKLYNRAKRHILYYFTSLTQSEEFLDLDLPDVVEHLSHKHLNCERESNVLKAITYWINHDYDVRIGLLDELLKCFHGEDLLPSEWEQIGSQRLLTETKAGKNWLLENEVNKKAACPRHQRFTKETDEESQMETDIQMDDKETKTAKYRQLPLEFLAAGGLDLYGKPSLDIFKLNPEKQEFSPYGNLKHGKISKHFKITSLGKDMYVTGGQDDIGKSETFNMDVWKYDAFTEEWSIVTRLPLPRRHHAACASNSSLYLLSGFGKYRQKLESVQEYNTIQDEWHDLPSMPEACPYANAVCCSDMLLVYMGSCLYSYSFKTTNWTTITDIKSDVRFGKHVNHSCVVFDRCVYYFNFHDSSSIMLLSDEDLQYEVSISCVTKKVLFERLDTETFKMEVCHSNSKKVNFGNNIIMVGERFYILNYNSKDLMSWSVYKDTEVVKLGSGKNVLHFPTLVALVKYPQYDLVNKNVK